MSDLALLFGGGTLGALGGAVIILLRMLSSTRRVLVDADSSTRKLLVDADKRYTEEAAHHEQTQALLDAERKIRREMEDKFEQQLRALRTQVAEQTAKLDEQTRRIAHLEAEVGRLSAGAS